MMSNPYETPDSSKERVKPPTSQHVRRVWMYAGACAGLFFIAYLTKATGYHSAGAFIASLAGMASFMLVFWVIISCVINRIGMHDEAE